MRGTWIAAALIASLAVGAASAGEIDHVIVGASDLETASAELSAHTGIATLFGGVHTTGGTANRLASLGQGRYLELLGPAPGKPPFEEGARLARMQSPLPYGFAIRVADAEAEAARLKAAGLKVSPVEAGGRTTPQGARLSWKTFAVEDSEFCAVLPFFIQWGAETPHPSTTSPAGGRLQGLRVFHPRPEALGRLYEILGVPLKPEHGAAHIELTLSGPRGETSFTGAPPC